MKKLYPLNTCLLLTALLIGCDSQEGIPTIEETISLPETTPAKTIPEPPEPIDLTISDDMLEQELYDKGFLAPIEIPTSTKDLTRKEAENLRLSGKLHLDDRETENYQDYIDSVEGGEVNVEVKFK